jgi:hypothetical protein
MIRWKGLPGFFISNGKKGKERGIMARQRVREIVCARGRALRQEKDSVANKTDSWRINM